MGLKTHLFLTGLGATILSVLSILAFHFWRQANYFSVDAGRFAIPFTTFQWFSLLTLMYISPLAFAFSTRFFTSLIRVNSTGKYASNFYLSAIIFMILLVAVIVWSLYVMETFRICGFVFCYHQPDNWIMDPIDITNEGLGWMNNFGAMLGVPAVMLVLSLLSSMVIHYFNYKYDHNYCQVEVEPTNSTSLSVSLLKNTHDQVKDDEDEFGNVMNNGLSFHTPYQTTFVTRELSPALSSTSHPYYENNTYRNNINKDKTRSPFVPNINTTSSVSSRHFYLKKYLTYIIYFAFLAAITITAAIVPNLWRSTSPQQIAMSVMRQVVTTVEACGRRGPYDCPEFAWAFFKTIQVTIDKKYLHLRFYPSNIIFFSYLFIIPFLALLIRSFSCLDKPLSKKFKVSWNFNGKNNNRHAFFSFKELLMILATLVEILLFAYYWYFDHNYRRFWPGSELFLSERIMRTFGQITVLFMSLLLFPAARNSPILSLFGISYENAIQYHRWLGVLFVIGSFLHMVTAYWNYWDYYGNLWYIVQLPFIYDGIQDYTVPVIQYITWISFFTFGVLSVFSYFRRYYYRIFLLSHHITYFIMIPCVIMHAPASWEYLLPGIFIWLADRAVRHYRSVSAVHLAPSQLRNDTSSSIFAPDSVTTVIEHNTTIDLMSNTHSHVNINNSNSIVSRFPPSSPFPIAGRFPAVCTVTRGNVKYVELRVSNDGIKYLPGQYVFVNILELGGWHSFEHHPMTVASPVHSTARPEAVLVMKVMEEGSWTRALYDYIQTKQNEPRNSISLEDNIQVSTSFIVVDSASDYSNDAFAPIPLTISLDGPYGKCIDYSIYDKIILIGGGVGITPCKSVFESLYLSYLHDYLPHTLATEDTSSINNLHPAAINSINVKLDKIIHMLFFARDVNLFNIVEESVQFMPVGPFSAKLVCSLDNEEQRQQLKPSLKNVTSFGRTDTVDYIYSALGVSQFDDIKTIMKDQRVLLFVCGPEPLNQQIENIAYEFGFDFHAETFDL